MRNIAFTISLVFLLKFTNCQNMVLQDVIVLPKPSYKGHVSVEEALQKRRSVRSYGKDSLELTDVSQVLWAAYGTTSGRKKTCPSAGATYPLEIYLLAGNVKGLATGFYRYNPDDHTLKLLSKKDYRKQLTEASLHQEYIQEAPASIVIAANSERTTKVYGKRGERYVYMEVGHCGQNIHLQCESLNLGTVIIGAFEDEKVEKILNIDGEPMYIMPIGRKP